MAGGKAGEAMSTMFIVLSRKTVLRAVIALAAALALLVGGCLAYARAGAADTGGGAASSQDTDYIKWVDFDVPYELLSHALDLDIASHDTDTPVSWIELLAYAASKNGNNWKSYTAVKLDETVKALQEGAAMEDLTRDLTYYDYYHEAYSAVLGGLVGYYEIEVPDETAESGKRWEARYGLKGFSPIARNYPYSDFDDFGSSRDYGFKRKHLGHDLMGAVGTPIIAVEGGTVEALGWNQYGGWRIGIRSFDQKRYYYYAHLRKNFPYNKELEIGSVVQPGDVIGYLGRTGYSVAENVNNIEQPHLHFGLQLIFDESQKEGNNEIWVDVYPLVRLLYRNRSTVVKNEETKEYHRVYQIRDPAVPESPPATATSPARSTAASAAASGG
ncbi:MAG TPA: M23 family metallopeptidase [Firmicutes bacterium]|nr:M23 family metallopeptidase [Bacillota bacterium]